MTKNGVPVMPAALASTPSWVTSFRYLLLDMHELNAPISRPMLCAITCKRRGEKEPASSMSWLLAKSASCISQNLFWSAAQYDAIAESCDSTPPVPALLLTQLPAERYTKYTLPVLT